jgi:hypothetical protein
MVASLWGSVGTGRKEDVSRNGRVWTAGFHHITACSLLAHFKTYEPFISLIFQIFSGRGKPRIRGPHVYFYMCMYMFVDIFNVYVYTFL